MSTVGSQLTSPTTWGSILGGLGTAVTGAGYFYPPLILVGAMVSAIAKVFTGMKTADAKPEPDLKVIVP